MKTFILFIYISSFSAQGGMTLATAEFNSEKACLEAAAKASKEFKTFFVQPIKTLCVEK